MNIQLDLSFSAVCGLYWRQWRKPKHWRVHPSVCPIWLISTYSDQRVFRNIETTLLEWKVDYFHIQHTAISDFLLYCIQNSSQASFAWSFSACTLEAIYAMGREGGGQFTHCTRKRWGMNFNPHPKTLGSNLHISACMFQSDSLISPPEITTTLYNPVITCTCVCVCMCVCMCVCVCVCACACACVRVHVCVCEVKVMSAFR